MKKHDARDVSVVKDAHGNSVVLINDIQFNGKRKINWDEVKEYIKEFVGNSYAITETNDVIYIGADFPDEYTGSEYTESLRGTRAKAKANATQGIPELLSISKGKHFKENQSIKHKRNAKFGWYRYNSRFALPVYGNDGNVERYNLFHASMLIRYSSEGKMFLYDIIDIKKETSNSLSLSLPDKKPISLKEFYHELKK